MILSRRAEERLLAAARRTSGDHSLAEVERYRVRPWVGYGLGVLATGALIVGIMTGTGWLAMVFLGVMVVTWFVDRRITVAAGPSGAFVFRDTVWGPNLSSDFHRLGPGDVERIGARRWRVLDHDLWIFDPTGPLLERLPGGA